LLAAVEARSPGRVSACAWSLVGAGAAAADHVLVLSGVLCSTAYVAGEGGRSSPDRVSACAWEPVWRQRIMCWSCRTSVLDGRMSPKKKAVAAAAAVCVAGGEERACVAWRLDRLSGWAWRRLCAVGVWRPDPKKRRPDHVSILHGGVCAPGDVCRPEKEAASKRGETASFIAAGGARLQRQCGSVAWRKWP
jgi:hypothetical protein